MRQIYTSPRPENIDSVVALMAEHGIQATVSNRSNYHRRGWQRHSYSPRRQDRSQWPQVWITWFRLTATIDDSPSSVRCRPLIQPSWMIAVVRRASPGMGAC